MLYTIIIYIQVQVNEVIYVGKRIHEILLDARSIGSDTVYKKYKQECKIMSTLHHENVIKFIGQCFLHDSQFPVLVMERLKGGNLQDFLLTIPNIVLNLKVSILADVSKGLLYLHQHSPQIVHQDLTAKNVLLTPSLRAKISDFANTRIIHSQLVQKMFQLPEIAPYMPPEAFHLLESHLPSFDIFSFGHLALIVGLQV